MAHALDANTQEPGRYPPGLLEVARPTRRGGRTRSDSARGQAVSVEPAADLQRRLVHSDPRRGSGCVIGPRRDSGATDRRGAPHKTAEAEVRVARLATHDEVLQDLAGAHIDQAHGDCHFGGRAAHIHATQEPLAGTTDEPGADSTDARLLLVRAVLHHLRGQRVARATSAAVRAFRVTV